MRLLVDTDVYILAWERTCGYWLKDATPDGILYIENMFGGFGCWVGEFALFWVFPLIS